VLDRPQVKAKVCHACISIHGARLLVPAWVEKKNRSSSLFCTFQGAGLGKRVGPRCRNWFFLTIVEVVGIFFHLPDSPLSIGEAHIMLKYRRWYSCTDEDID
jgi:hypothetical protein